jgi:predicted nucleic acid-binding protein
MKAVVEDTDVVSFAFKGDTRVCLYASDLTNASLIVSFMTVAELRLWGRVQSWGDRRVEQLTDYLSREFAIHPATGELCDVWAELKFEARRKGRGLDTVDAWIAATAIPLGVPLVTHNGRDFDFLSRLNVVSYSPQ